MNAHPNPQGLQWHRGQNALRAGVHRWGPMVLLLSAVLIAALTGLLAGLGSPLLLAPVVALIGALGLLLLPTTWLLAFLIVYSMAVVGPAVYFFSVESARWLAPMLSLALLLPLVLRTSTPKADVRYRHSTPGFVLVFGLFLVHVVFTTIINEPSLGEALNTPRYYLTPVALVLLLMRGAFGPDQWERVWQFLLWFTLVQLPVAAVQHFVYAARRVREAPWDAVVGTFPGQAEGGGASHGLGVYMLTAVVFALALRRQGRLGTRSLLVIGACVVGTILLAEVKAVVLLIPVVLALVFLREIRRRPLVLFASAAVGLVLAVGVLSVYDRVFYKDAKTSWAYSNAPTSALEGVRNQFDPERFSRYTPPSRAASFVLWWDRHVQQGDYLGLLIGHGGASTHSNRVGVGDLTRRYAEPLHQTTTGMLLWETGAVGHALVLLALLMAAYRASRLAQDVHIPDVHRAMLHAAGVAVLLHVLTLPYQSFVMLTAPSQLLLGLLLGYIAFWARERSSRVGRQTVARGREGASRVGHHHAV